MEVLRLENVTFQYPEEPTNILENISFQVNEGDFVVLCGESGSGKTTLLHLIKRELAPYGNENGNIYYEGEDIHSIDSHKLATNIGIVLQDPDHQIIMDEVVEEITFGMENVAIPPIEMRKRLAELVHFFGVQSLLYAKTNTLSGGQKQLINLLSVLLLRPKVLLLDEPTSQLDPIAAKELIQILERLNREMGMTIIVAEHRLEDLFAIANKVVVLEEGIVKYEGETRDIIGSIYERKDQKYIHFLPSYSRLYMQLESNVQKKLIPLNVKETREWLKDKKFESTNIETIKELSQKPIISLEKLHYQYEKGAPFVLNNVSLQINQEELFALVGSNGAGKTTLLKVMLGILKAQRGNIKIKGKKLQKYKQTDRTELFAYMPQHPLSFFMEDTIIEEMEMIVNKYNLSRKEEKIKKLAQQLQISNILYRHPSDISGGELQRAVLACLLLHKPSILILDEPTKGLDPLAKKQLANILTELQNEGLTIFIVSHDIEFIVQYADRCAILFDGNITAEGTPKELFQDNYFYTTSIQRATNSLPKISPVLTVEEAIKTWE